MLATFVKEAIPEPVVCLGIGLRPFSLGHYWLLNKWRSPFVMGGRANIADLIYAVLICSRDFEAALQLLADPGDEIQRLEKRVMGSRFFGRRITKAFELVHEHVRRGMAEPLYYIEVGGGMGTIGSDWSMLAVAKYMTAFGATFDEAVNTFAPLVRYLVAVNAEHEGLLRMTDAAEVSDSQAEADKIAAEFWEEERRKNGTA